MDDKKITLKNIGKNFISLITSEIVGRILGTIVLLIVPRYLGPANYGIYVLAISYFSLFSVFANYGLNGLFIKDVARDKTLSQEYFITNILLKELLSILSIVVLVVLLYTLDYPSRTIQIILIMSAAIFFDTISQTNSAVFRSYEKMEYNALLSISRSVLALFGALTVVNLRADVLWLALISTITYIILATVGIIIIQKKFFKLIWTTTQNAIIGTFQKSTPFFLVSAVAIIQDKIDIVMLSRFVKNEEVGLFGAANELVSVLYVVPNLIATVLFPVFTRQYHESSQTLVASSNLSIKYIAMIGLPMSTGIYFVAPDVISLIYGNAYSGSVRILQILGISISVLFIQSMIAYVLTAADRIKHVTSANIINISVHIILNLWLIPIWGAKGAAVSIFIAGLISSLYLYKIYASSFEGTIVLKNITKPLLATLIMGVLIWWINANLIVSILLGVITYGMALVTLKALNKEEIGMIRYMIPFLSEKSV